MKGDRTPSAGADAQEICAAFDKVNDEMAKMALNDLPQDNVRAVPLLMHTHDAPHRPRSV